MIIIIIILIIIIIIVTVLYIIKEKNNTTYNSDTVNNKNVNVTNNLKIETNGELYQSEPCQATLISDDGICKKKPGDTCMMTSDCIKSHCCFFGTCTPKPLTWDECFNTTCNDGLVCIDHHLMQLKNNKFVMLPGWWSFSGCIDICEAPIKNYVYILKEDGLCLVNPDEPKSIVKLIINDNLIIRIFILRNALHALTENGKIYRGLSHHEMLKKDPTIWEWEHIEFIFGRDISSDFIVDVITSPDGIFSIYISDGRRLTYDNSWMEEIMIPIILPKMTSSSSTNSLDNNIKLPSRIIYGTNKYNYINLTYGKATLYILDNNTSKSLYTIEKVRDAVIDPLDNQSIIAIYNNRSIKRINYNNDSIIESVIDGQGETLRVANNNIWLLTSNKCIRV